MLIQKDIIKNIIKKNDQLKIIQKNGVLDQNQDHLVPRLDKDDYQNIIV